MALDVRVGRQADFYVVKYTPKAKTSLRELRPIVYNDLSENGLFKMLEGLESIYNGIELKSLTIQEGVGRELTSQELEEIRKRLRF